MSVVERAAMAYGAVVADEEAPAADGSSRNGSGSSRSLPFPLLCAAYLSVGCIFYGMTAGWTILETVYFVSISITTVGYGDLCPQTDLQKAFTVLYILCGLSLVYDRIAAMIDDFFEDLQKQSDEQLRDAQLGQSKGSSPSSTNEGSSSGNNNGSMTTTLLPDDDSDIDSRERQKTYVCVGLVAATILLGGTVASFLEDWTLISGM